MTDPSATLEPTTKQRLLDAAEEVFAAKGYEAASVEEITRKAGANRAAISFHFEPSAPRAAAVPLYAAVLLAAGGLLLTLKAAPIMLGIRSPIGKMSCDPTQIASCRVTDPFGTPPHPSDSCEPGRAAASQLGRRGSRWTTLPSSRHRVGGERIL